MAKLTPLQQCVRSAVNDDVEMKHLYSAALAILPCSAEPQYTHETVRTATTEYCLRTCSNELPWQQYLFPSPLPGCKEQHLAGERFTPSLRTILKWRGSRTSPWLTYTRINPVRIKYVPYVFSCYVKNGPQDLYENLTMLGWKTGTSNEIAIQKTIHNATASKSCGSFS